MATERSDQPSQSALFSTARGTVTWQERADGLELKINSPRANINRAEVNQRAKGAVLNGQFQFNPRAV